MGTSKPKLHLRFDRKQKIIQILAILGLMICIVLATCSYGDLPDEIPRHFGIDGHPDAWGSKNYIWTLPVLALLIYTFLNVLIRYPHLYNYSVEITAPNAAFQYGNAILMIQVLCMELMWIFAYMTYETINIAQGRDVFLSKWFLPCFLLILFGTIIYFFVRSRRVSNGDISRLR